MQSLNHRSQLDKIMCYLVLETSVVYVVTGKVISNVLYVVSKVILVSDESISAIQNQRSYRCQ